MHIGIEQVSFLTDELSTNLFFLITVSSPVIFGNLSLCASEFSVELYKTCDLKSLPRMSQESLILCQLWWLRASQIGAPCSVTASYEMLVIDSAS